MIVKLEHKKSKRMPQQHAKTGQTLHSLFWAIVLWPFKCIYMVLEWTTTPDSSGFFFSWDFRWLHQYHHVDWIVKTDSRCESVTLPLTRWLLHQLSPTGSSWKQPQLRDFDSLNSILAAKTPLGLTSLARKGPDRDLLDTIWELPVWASPLIELQVHCSCKRNHQMVHPSDDSNFQSVCVKFASGEAHSWSA